MTIYTVYSFKYIADFIKSRFNQNTDIKLAVKDVFQSTGKYESLIACPPYGTAAGNIENWNFDSTGNSLDKNLTGDQWIDECLKRFDCKRYVFVVDENGLNKYKNNVIENLQNKNRFGSNIELIVVIDKS